MRSGDFRTMQNDKPIEDRRAIIERAFRRAERAGLPVERSPEFEEWLEEWVRREIDIGTLRGRYIDLLRRRDIAWRTQQNSK